MRGQPLGDSAVNRFVSTSIRPSIGEWNDETDVGAEQYVLAQHFNVHVLGVEGVMGSYSREFDGRLIIRVVCDREVGQSGDAGGRRLSDGRYRTRVSLRACDGFKRTVLRELRIEVSLRKSQGRM